MINQIADVFESLDKVTIFTPLGIRFWDVALAVPVIDGLVVSAWPQGMPQLSTRAFQTPSGIYAFRDLPGLHDVEYPVGDVFATSPPGARRFTVEVIDTERRFLPAAFGVDLPFQGIFPLGSRNTGPPGFYLFSAPTRPTSSSLASVRAQLSELIGAGAQRPAAYAVVEVDTPDNGIWFGIADTRGCVSVMFPYPPFTKTPGGSSPGPSPMGSSQQHWGIRITVRYMPSALTFPDGSNLPDLRSVFNQGPGKITMSLTAPAGQPVNQMDAELVFGQELVLRTDQGSALIIGPAASP